MADNLVFRQADVMELTGVDVSIEAVGYPETPHP
jgi:hypothetical protein